MAEKVKKNLTLAPSVAERLEEEPNQSELVEKLLREHFDDVPEYESAIAPGFIEECLSESSSGYVPSAEIRQAYSEYASENGLIDLEPGPFGRALHQTGLNIRSTQKRIDGSRIRIYKGIELTDQAEALL